MSMTHRPQLFTGSLAVLGLAILISSPPIRGQEPRVRQVTAVTAGDLRTWDGQVDRMIRSRELEVRLDREDTLIPGRRHTRYTQMVKGVPIYGADIARQTDEKGLTISIFGTLHEGVDIPTTPAFGGDRVRAMLEARTGVQLGPEREPSLAILPMDDGRYTLVYLARVATPEDLTLYFVDAQSGEIVSQRSDAKRQSPSVGVGIGVLGERKKVSSSSQGGTYVGSDRLRPPVIETYDMRGNLTRLLSILNGFTGPAASDFANDSDNDWTDGANVDAHVYAGYTYDYYFKRFGRRGLDNANIRIRSFTHPVNRADATRATPSVLFTFYLNAFYAGDGLMVYGEGIPPNLTFGGQQWNFLAGSLEVVAHELTHGVTDYSSGLIYQGESGALNEAFSDIMGTSAVFFFQQPGSGAGTADYIIGNDVVTPGGIRSLQDPRSFGDPDHYSIRYTGLEDNGGVHINSGIASHAFYLAIEGGTNRTSGLRVQGVGAANREQMEKIFYRAFTQLLPANARFTTARAATLQAAQDLYGGNSAVMTAVAQAWTAVGVN
jgi:Zn-dependent metalloprotease